MRKNPLLTDRIRYRYRKFILMWIPVRVYVIQTPLTVAEAAETVASIMKQFRWYFLYAGDHSYRYSGKFDESSFTAIKNNTTGIHRQIKVIGNFYLINNKLYLRLILSNPFSVVNIIVLFVLYFFMFMFKVTPFASYWANVLLYLSPILITYLATNFSFQSVYKDEKIFLFKLLKARRLKDDEISRIGV